MGGLNGVAVIWTRLGAWQEFASLFLLDFVYELQGERVSCKGLPCAVLAFHFCYHRAFVHVGVKASSASKVWPVLDRTIGFVHLLCPLLKGVVFWNFLQFFDECGPVDFAVKFP